MRIDTTYCIKLKVLLLASICCFEQITFAQSPLSTGEWYRVGVVQTGVHRLDATTLKKVGLNLNKISPQNLRVFGFKAGVLPQKSASPKELEENPIFVSGEADGRFDEQDYLWFYAESPHQILADVKTKSLSHQLNPYTDTTYYFLNVGSSAGLRINTAANANASRIINTYDDYQFQEKELSNLVHSGRNWLGDFVNTEQTYEFKTAGIIANSPVKIRFAAAVAAQNNTRFLLSLNQQNVDELAFGTVGSGRYDLKGWREEQTFTSKADGNAVQKIRLQFDKNGANNAQAYIDFVGIQTQRQLQTQNEQTVFRAFQSLENISVQYQIGGTSSKHRIWEVANSRAVQQYSLNNGSFGANSQNLKTFVLFSEDNTLVPSTIQSIANQNLKSLKTPNLLIVTAPSFQKEAQRLADFRQKNDGLQVAIVNTTQIFNEYGGNDPTAIRDFVREIHWKNPQQLKYLLLFGDATYDYKNHLRQEVYNPNKLVPVYESRESLHPIYSYSSDDYFGFLNFEEGDWQENAQGDHTLEIGVGRLPVKSEAEARNIVDKLISYGNLKKTVGKWRNQVAFVADDGDFNLHQTDALALSGLAETSNPQISTKPILVDAFPAFANANGQTSPKTNIAIQEAIEKGSLFINYNGHGGETGWAEEQILTIQNIQSWKGRNNLPIFLTATCQFGRYDDPTLVSGAEIGVLSPLGFSAGMLTTTRPVFANTNYLLNEAFYRSLDSLQYLRLGDIFRKTKNKGLSGVINRNFTLLGDPSMTLAFPKQTIRLNKINGKDIDKDTLQAQELVRFEGEILKQEKRDANFTGMVAITVYDKAQQRQTLGNKGQKIWYETNNNKIFEGKANVKQGIFNFTFVVPKNINYQIGNGTIEMYAIRQDSLSDAVGIERKIKIGGSIENPKADNIAPKLSFLIGNKIAQKQVVATKNDILIIAISDENGISFTGNGIGQDIEMWVNDTLKIKLNDSFSYRTDDYKAGNATYPLKNWKTGTYKIKVNAYDTYNNSASETLEIKVEENENPIIIYATAYPNPFQEKLTLRLDAEKENEDAVFLVQIVDANGNILKTWENVIVSSQTELVWDIQNESQQISNTGIYFFVGYSLKSGNIQRKAFSGKVLQFKSNH